jgi:hypothetical protein
MLAPQVSLKGQRRSWAVIRMDALSKSIAAKSRIKSWAVVSMNALSKSIAAKSRIKGSAAFRFALQASLAKFNYFDGIGACKQQIARLHKVNV